MPSVGLFSAVFGSGSSGISSALSGTAANYSALPAASSHADELWRVLAAQGTIFVNRKPSGIYSSDGAAWTYVADFAENDQASELSNDSSVSGTTIKDALNTLLSAVNAKLSSGVTTSSISDSTNRRYVTDAQLTVIGNTSGSNTGDQDLSSYATTSALALKAALASPALTGNPTAPTQTVLDNSTKLATTAYVDLINTVNGLVFFGDGSDGDATISSGTTTLTKDTFYRNLTINGTGILQLGINSRLFVSGILDISSAQTGAIILNGAAGSNASSNAGASAGASNSGTFMICPAKQGGTNGGAGSTTNGANVSPPSNIALLYATTSASAGDAGAGSGGTAGTGGGANFPTTGGMTVHRYVDNWRTPVAFNSGAGGSGGGGGGGDTSNTGGGGGGGGAGGGWVQIAARTIARGTNTNPGVIQALGGNGGNGFSPSAGNTGGGGGGSGGGGGTVIVYYGAVTGSTITGAIDVTGGTGGNGGALHGTGSGNGNGGGGGPSGYCVTGNLTTGVFTVGSQNAAVARKTGGTTAGSSPTTTRLDL